MGIKIFEVKGKQKEVSFRDTLRKAGIPIITFKQHNLDLNFIIDTGATTSLINDSCLNFIKDKELFVNRNDIVSGLDPTVEYSTKRYLIPIELNGELLQTEFNSMDLNATFDSLKEESGIEVHGLLGSDFLEQNKYVLDYNRKTIYHRV